ncbi:LysR family transcriptional regulator substrate-binding protein [Parvibacter caecicola]|uniref:LysR family transcriptional regulator n=1 Tax=Parvibacter caecicola TaxID=747645 RepID=A0A4T9T7E2_9ACTN|nr:LysR family transcriptional regulator substrate-binding protein [Parvibacter caecicola]TJW10253.1 LysR family transcriptional regulator [Parvibacter caecicola]
MAKTFSISGQHYLFDVQTFAQVVLATGGEECHYALLDRTTQGVIDDVANGVSDLGVIVETSETAQQLNEVLAQRGLEFVELITSAPRVALPASHPMVNKQKLTLEDMEGWPYVYFDQGSDAPDFFYEEALASVPRGKTIACTDRASLTELIVALNGYTVTSGILVGITDGSALTTVALDTDERLQLGYIVRRGAAISELEQKFLEKLKKNLEKYAVFN